MAKKKTHKIPTRKPVGRPSKYTPEIAAEICREISQSTKSLKTICKADHLPEVQTILTWLRDKPDFVVQYNAAKQEQADMMIEEMIDIADDGTNDLMQTKSGMQENREVTNRSKLRVETRKWIASKLKPKKYGDKVDVTSGGEPIKNEMVIKWGSREIKV